MLPGAGRSLRHGNFEIFLQEVAKMTLHKYPCFLILILFTLASAGCKGKISNESQGGMEKGMEEEVEEEMEEESNVVLDFSLGDTEKKPVIKESLLKALERASEKGPKEKAGGKSTAAVKEDKASNVQTIQVEPLKDDSPGVKKTEWLDDTTLRVTACVRLNCAEKIGGGDFRLSGNKITLIYRSPTCGNDEFPCARCLRAYVLIYKFSHIKKDTYHFELERAE
jgi:hypothetical protein